MSILAGAAVHGCGPAKKPENTELRRSCQADAVRVSWRAVNDGWRKDTEFVLHRVGTISDAGPHVEFSVGRAKRLLEPDLKVSNGKILLPDCPGWGTTIHMQEVVGSLWCSRVWTLVVRTGGSSCAAC
jgi:hypothetical protein